MWRSLCCGCRPGMSVYASAGRDALLNSSGSSRDRKRSRGGPGTAIVYHRITGRHTSHYIYIGQQVHADVHTLTHTHNSRDNELCHYKGQALDCSPVQLKFPLPLRKRGFRGVPSALSHTYSMHTVHQHAHRTKAIQHCTQTNITSHHAT